MRPGRIDAPFLDRYRRAMMDFPPGLSALSDRYDVVLSDVWGVIHNGVASFPEACEALTKWAQTKGPVVLISNSPRPSHDVVAQLDALGVPRSAWQGFVTSGDATRALLKANAPGKVWKIGPARDEVLYEGIDLVAAGCEDAGFISCTGLYEDEVEVPEDYRDRLKVAAERGLLFICANPDRVVQRGDRLIYCAGALADLYESLGGKVVMAGKPFGQIDLRPGRGRGCAPAGSPRRSRADPLRRRRRHHRRQGRPRPKAGLPVRGQGHPWRQGRGSGRPAGSRRRPRPAGRRGRGRDSRDRRSGVVTAF